MSEKREKDALISKARHNLKNPVNAILGFSEMLIEDCEDEGFEDILPDLKKIHDSGKEILKIIEESLSDSNVELSGEKISEIGRKMEISLRTPINTVIMNTDVKYIFNGFKCPKIGNNNTSII